jgi:hypothetical protein
MSKTALVILALALLVGPSTARAQVAVDVSKITCSQFVEYKIADPKDIIIWMNGYHHGLHPSLILDTQSLLENTKKIEEYCFKHPDLLVMKAVEEVVGQTP